MSVLFPTVPPSVWKEHSRSSIKTSHMNKHSEYWLEALNSSIKMTTTYSKYWLRMLMLLLFF